MLVLMIAAMVFVGEIPEMCVGLVDSYCGVIDTDSNTLKLKAEQYLPHGIEYFPSACQMNVRRSICSNVYRKCSPGVDRNMIYNLSESTSFWNYDMFGNVSYMGVPYSLPFERPCMEICTNITVSCNGLPELFGYDVNCSGLTFDYSDGLLASTDAVEPLYYDDTNNDTNCSLQKFDVKSNLFVELVGVTSEPYLQVDNTSGACYGIVDYDVYIPSADTVSSELSKLQRPFMVQNLLESKLTRIFEQVPKWLEKKCYVELKKYFCSWILKPSILVNISELDEIFVPSYPNRSICEEYEKSCSPFFLREGHASRLNAISPLIFPNCTAVLDGVVQYPVGKQTVEMKSVLRGDRKVNYTTNSNALSTVSFGSFEDYESSCPFGVVPEHPLDDGVSWFEGTGCSSSCITRSYSTEEWKHLDRTSILMVSIGFVIISFIIFTNFSNERKKEGFFFLRSFFIMSAIEACFFLIMNATGRSMQQRFCDDNAVKLNVDDGMSMCVFQAGLRIYVFLAGCCAWMFQCIFLFVKIAIEGNVVVTPVRLGRICVIIFLFPLISVYYFVSTSSIGYTMTNISCFLTLDTFREGKDLIGVVYPICFMTFVGFVCIVGVCIKAVVVIVPRIRRHNNLRGDTQERYGPIFQSLILLRPAIAFVMIYLVIFTVILFLRIRFIDNYMYYRGGYLQWVDCFFLNNYANSEAEKTATNELCGNVPEIRIEAHFRLITIVVGPGHCIILCCMETIESVLFWLKKIQSYSSITPHPVPRFNSEGVAAVADISINRNESECFVEVEHFDMPEECAADAFDTHVWGPVGSAMGSGKNGSSRPDSGKNGSLVTEFDLI